MSFLARLSLANRGLVAIIAIVVLGFGAIAIPSLKQQLIPSIDFPAAFVVASYPGVSPDIVEEQVAKPIESALQGVPGLTDITSTSREGVLSLSDAGDQLFSLVHVHLSPGRVEVTSSSQQS